MDESPLAGARGHGPVQNLKIKGDWYQNCRFQLAGLVDILSAERTAYTWMDRPGELRPQSSIWLAVFRNNRLAVP